MGQTIPSQHPAVVLRSHFRLVRALLAVAMIAVVGLSTAVVIVANDRDQVSSTDAARPAESVRYGAFNPATGRPESASLPQSQAQRSAGTTRSAGAGASGKDYSKNAATGDTAGDAPESLNGPGARTN